MKYFTLIIALIALVLALPKSNTIATVDIAKITSQFIQELDKTELSDVAKDKKLAMLHDILEQELAELKTQETILVKQAVLSNSKDYTNAVFVKVKAAIPL